MKNILKKSEKITLRYTEIDDLDFVINAEQKKENAQYVDQWTKDEHITSLSNKDIIHLIIEDKDKNSVGYIIIAGVEKISKSIEFKRLVICDKNKGYGREVLKLIKDFSFNDLKAHRLWLDVRLRHKIAQELYKSEGFKEEGILRECILYNNQYESIVIMSILSNEYINN